MQQAPVDHDSEHGEGLSFFKKLHLNLSKQYYSYAPVLGLQRLKEYFQGATPLLASSGAVWVLGEKYENPSSTKAEALEEKLLMVCFCQPAPAIYNPQRNVMEDILLDFASRIWMTYRSGLQPIGGTELTSDAGWGCTLRSGQMLLAQVLLQHLCGRQWRRPSNDVPEHSAVAQILSRFWDSPTAEHPFSIHNLVAAGKSSGVVAGQWLGPWTLCRTLQNIVNGAQPADLHVHLANTPGGSAPVLYTASVEKLFIKEVKKGDEQQCQAQPGVLILIPLVLGVGKVNPRYTPQLLKVLEWPQSSGIVGGRPSSSLYFVGHQDNAVIYLDPHTLQERGASPKEVSSTHFCSSPRTLPVESIDPSLAIAFYCRSAESFKDLTERLKVLENLASGAPLINIVEGDMPPPYKAFERLSSLDQGGSKGDEPWELL